MQSDKFNNVRLEECKPAQDTGQILVANITPTRQKTGIGLLVVIIIKSAETIPTTSMCIHSRP